MISANTFFKKLTGVTVISLFLFIASCGNKLPPIPPRSPRAVKPTNPVVMQRGDDFVITIKNPFVKSNGEWELKLLRYKKTFLPTETEEEKEQTTDAVEPETVKSGENPELIVIDKKSMEINELPEVKSINEEDFIDLAEPILIINYEQTKESALSSEIKYVDPVESSDDSHSWDVYYYAVEADDSEGETEGYSKISAITKMKVAPALELKKPEPEEKKITLVPTGLNTLKNLENRFIQSLQYYRGECEKDDYSLLASVSLAPESWKINGLVSTIPVFNEYDPENPVTEYYHFITGGVEGQGVSQAFLDKAEVAKLKGSVLNISITMKSSLETLILITGTKLIEKENMVIPSSDDFKTTEFKVEIEEYDEELKFVLATTSRVVGSIDLKKISVKPDDPALLTSLKKNDKSESKSENVKPVSEKPEEKKIENKKPEKESPEKEQPEKESGELLKNSDFNEIKTLYYDDTKFTFGTAYCYCISSGVKWNGGMYESALSEPVKVIPVDNYPPGTPAGLYSLARLDSITLIWKPNTEKDLAGYNIYRQEGENGTPVKLNEKIFTDTEYVDTPPMSDESYFYYVTAVDNSAGANESSPGKKIQFIPRQEITNE